MKQINNNYMKEKISFIVLTLLLILPIISAVSLSPGYTTDTPLKITAGEIKNIDVLMVGSSSVDTNNGSITAKAELVDGSGIATLNGNGKYSITVASPAKVNVKLAIPKDAVEGTKYTITLKITDITNEANSEGGMVSLAKTSTASIPVVVVKPEPVPTTVPTTPEKPQGDLTWAIIIIVIVVIIAIVAFFLLKNKKK